MADSSNDQVEAKFQVSQSIPFVRFAAAAACTVIFMKTQPRNEEQRPQEPTWASPFKSSWMNTFELMHEMLLSHPERTVVRVHANFAEDLFDQCPSP